MNKPKILVVGSFVMDLIVSTKRFPNAGESVVGYGFSTAPGGKGANQAVQAARLGAEVTMVGKVGNDDFGKQIIRSANESGVNTQYVLHSDTAPTAIGNVQIQSNENGTENRIIVVPGANMEITIKDIEFLAEKISDYDLVMLQNEIPMEFNIKVAQYAKAKGVPVMLNPAPYSAIPAELLACLTYISPNEHEAADMVGFEITDDETRKNAVLKLKELGVENVLITLGKNGCVFDNGDVSVHSGSIDCGKVVDPTAAGDSFMGAFCFAVVLGASVEQALLFANCTAGITVSRMGAQTSLPTLDEVLNIMKNRGFDYECFK